MTNLEKIRSLNPEELAKLLIRSETVNEGDFDWDENPIDWYVDRWVCPDGEMFYDFDEEGAIEHTIIWLNSEENEEIDEEN